MPKKTKSKKKPAAPAALPEAIPGEQEGLDFLSACSEPTYNIFIENMREDSAFATKARKKRAESGGTGGAAREGPAGAMLAARPPPAGYKLGDLRSAVDRQDRQTVQQLLAAGVDPNAFGERLSGWPPLHFAAKRGDAAIVQMLLEAGADPQFKDTQGELALSQAGYWGHQSVVDILVAKTGRGGTERKGLAKLVPPAVSLPAAMEETIGPWDADGEGRASRGGGGGGQKQAGGAAPGERA
eukprot:COSAG02_NODE_18085_length_962_cov_0.721900_1_plen_241_part_00